MPIRIKIYSVGLLGFGKVIRAFLRHYLENKEAIMREFGFELEFVAIADSRSFVKGIFDIQRLIEIKEAGKPLGNTERNSLKAFIPLFHNRGLDILIDGIPGSRTDAGMSFPYLLEAIKNHVNIICINKSPLVFKGDELLFIAKQKKVYIGTSATTGGALPISGILRNELINAGVYNVRGVLNGTSNFVLDKIMFESKTKLEAIKEAIKLGIAEPDYRFDLEGIDTCYKTIILGLLLTGKRADLKSIPCRGIMEIDEKEIFTNVKKGKVMRLIGNLFIREGEPLISVKPEYLGNNDPLYSIYGANKGVTFRTKHIGDLTIIGGSSGLGTIGATILKDIINFHRYYKK